MYFPIAEVHIVAWHLILIGFAVGVCGSFWGMGGGWITTPTLFALGVAMPIAVGTTTTQVVGLAVVAASWHRKLGNISRRVALALIPAEMVGVEMGARILQHIKTFGRARADAAISLLFIILLGAMAAYTLWECVCRLRQLAAARQQRAAGADIAGSPEEEQDQLGIDLAGWIRNWQVAPLLKPRKIRQESISLWVIVASGLLAGTVIGLMGVGGGFLRVPMLVYIIGCPTRVAVGTSMIALVMSGAYGSFTHALKGNVDLLMALYILMGSAVGAQIGSLATRYVQGVGVRISFAVALTVVMASLVLKTYFNKPEAALVVIIGVAGLMAATIIILFVRGALQQPRQQAVATTTQSKGKRLE